MSFDIKIIFALIAFSIASWGYFSYIKGILHGETKPHAYTWFIWSITIGIATAGLWVGNGGYPAITLGIGTVLTCVIFLLSLRYGTKNITTGDTVTLCGALAAIGAWVFLHNPLLSVTLATAIDAVGYWPSIRKSFTEPWDEPMSAWIPFTISGFFSILALNTYTPITTMYYLMCVVLNLIIMATCFFRRRTIPKPNN